ncbi:MAG: ion transporter [Candidatus Peregrinibacteria bacterium]
METTTPPKIHFWYHFDRFLHEGFGNEESRLYQVINNVIVFLIFFSILSIVFASVEEIYQKYQTFFDLSEKIVVGIFTFEYIANIYVAQRKRDYILGPWGIIDFMAIAPSYMNMIDLRAIKVLRVLRVLRFLRLMRMVRLLKLAKTATKGFGEKKESPFSTLKMDLQIYFIALFSLVILSSTLIYYAERVANGAVYSSIPKAMWWSIVTITTVGYGDMFPITVWGRLVAAVTMLFGLALFGLLMNVIGKSMMSSLFGAADLETMKVESKEAETMLAKEEHREHSQG